MLRCTIADIGVGTFGKVVTVHMDTPLIDVLQLLRDQHISAVPVTNDHGTCFVFAACVAAAAMCLCRCVCVCVCLCRCRAGRVLQDRRCGMPAPSPWLRCSLVSHPSSSAQLLAQEKVYDINMSVRAALSKRPAVSVAPTCRRTDSLKTVMERLAATGVHRLICVDDAGRVDGIVSLHDIFAFLIADTPAQRVYEAEMAAIAARLAEMQIAEGMAASPTRMRSGSVVATSLRFPMTSPRGSTVGPPQVSPRGVMPAQVSPRALAALRTPPAPSSTAPAGATSPLRATVSPPGTRRVSPALSPRDQA